MCVGGGYERVGGTGVGKLRDGGGAFDTNPTVSIVDPLPKMRGNELFIPVTLPVLHPW